MPIAADVNGDYLCMHGGISQELHSRADIDKVNRFIEPPLSGFLCDLLWSDPVDDKDARKYAFTKNPQRECSVKFGLDPVKKILKANNFISIIRAHQVQVDGYKMHRWGGTQCFPSVITVFSAPNYCGEYHNKGAVILIENEKMNIKQYKDVPYPFHLPGGIDLFKWSIPFLMEKVTDMLRHVATKMGKLPAITEQEIKSTDVAHLLEEQAKLNQKAPASNDKEKQKLHRMEVMRAKVKTVARMNLMFKTLR